MLDAQVGQATQRVRGLGRRHLWTLRRAREGSKLRALVTAAGSSVNLCATNVSVRRLRRGQPQRRQSVPNLANRSGAKRLVHGQRVSEKLKP
jgi:hypothetical protein